MKNKKQWLLVFVSIFVCFNIFTANIYAYASEITLNRVSSSYSEAAAYNTDLKTYQNCYGYALQLYSTEYDLRFPNNQSYKQVPGEFSNSMDFGDLEAAYYYHKYNDTDSYLMDFVESMIFEDFSTLNSLYGNEWVIQPTSVSSAVPSGYRKIALVIMRNWIGSYCEFDYHFYMRHDNGKWSHKRGSTDIQNLSIGTQEELTDSNINSLAQQGDYDKGIRYYLIKKSAVVDYPHENGHYDSCGLTAFLTLRDEAGVSLEKSAIIVNSHSGRFDYSGDIDCFRYYATATGTYTISVSAGSTTADIDIDVYDKNGLLLTYDHGAGNPSVSWQLSAYTYYFIKVKDYNNTKTTYTLTFTH